MDYIESPFTPEQVEGLNRYQRLALTHPFTCANRGDAAHAELDPEGDYGVLVATEAGWVCRHCDYTQTWAHAFMADSAALARLNAQTAKIREAGS